MTAGQPEGVGQQQGREWRPGDPCPKCGAQNRDNRVDQCTTASGRDHKARWAGPVSQRRRTRTSTPAPSPTPPARDSGRDEARQDAVLAAVFRRMLAETRGGHGFLHLDEGLVIVDAGTELDDAELAALREVNQP